MLEAKPPLGNQTGLRFVVKDNFSVAGWPTTAGSQALHSSPVADQHCAIVERLLRAEFCFLGRAKMHELAFGVTGINDWTGSPVNPNYPVLIPGGSSSGSAAAVAARCVDFAIGTDTGGSIRVPAACCGVIGFKPTFGRVNRDGIIPHRSSLDCAGPFARDVATVEMVMAALTDDWRTVNSPKSCRLGWVSVGGDSAVLASLHQSSALLGEIEEVVLPGLAEAEQAGLAIIGRESWAAFGHLTETGLLGRDVHERLLGAARLGEAEVVAAEIVRRSFTAQVDAALANFDALILPAIPHRVPSLLEAKNPALALKITSACRPFNLSGHPAIVLPAGEVDGRPVSLQLVGRKGGDEELCALAARFAVFRKGKA